jgi:hypothetical protein
MFLFPVLLVTTVVLFFGLPCAACVAAIYGEWRMAASFAVGWLFTVGLQLAVFGKGPKEEDKEE